MRVVVQNNPPSPKLLRILFQSLGQPGIDAEPRGGGGDVDAAVKLRRRADQEASAQGLTPT